MNEAATDGTQGKMIHKKKKITVHTRLKYSKSIWFNQGLHVMVLW